MFERFTEKAIKIIMLAQEEARRLGHNFVGTEFILLGIIGEGTGIAAKTLKSFGVNLKDARKEAEKITGRGGGFVAVEIPFTPDAKRQLELAWDEAKQLGHNYIGTEHLLLALTRLQESDGFKVLEVFIPNSPEKLRPRVTTLIKEVSPTGVNRHPELGPDDIEKAVNKAVFEAIIIALPTKSKAIALNLMKVVDQRQKAVLTRQYQQATDLRKKEVQLLEQLTNITKE